VKFISKFLLWTVIGLFAVSVAVAAPSKKSPAKKFKTNETTAVRESRAGDRLDNVGGPDGFGYLYVDNQNGDTATYSWIELRGNAQAAWLDFSSNPDDMVLPVHLSFNFPIYGLDYDTIWISTNGNIQFETQESNYWNECLPSDLVVGRMICVLWDDLDLSAGGYDPGGAITVGYRDFGDHVVVEWDSVGAHGEDNTSYKFEAILWADGRIKLQYQQLVNLEVQSQTIGIQAGGTGPHLEYVCDDTGHQAIQNLALWFYPGPTGTIAGVVRDDDGVPISLAGVVILQLNLITYTDTDGEYAFPMVGVGSYTMRAQRYGYVPDSVHNVVVTAGQTTTQDFVLSSEGIHTFVSNDIPKIIHDNQTAVSLLPINESLTITDLDAQVNIIHTYDGDLMLSLVSPAGDTVVLSAYNGSDGANYTNTIFDDDAFIPIGNGEAPFDDMFIPDEPLTIYDGQNTQGTWQLLVFDDATGDTGQLIGWELHIIAAMAANEALTAAPAHFKLYDSYPNPFNSSTVIRFAVPRTAPVKLSLYNVLGQEVRELVSGSLAAGEHRAVWDGRDNRGMDAASGLYFVRLEAAGHATSGKLFLLR
jgi:subtilisin-like proprotein convertase family protein